MPNVLLLANLNCDRVLLLNKPLTTGGRHHYDDMGRRLGGGGANTGLGLPFAGHNVSLVSQFGNDKTSDGLLAQANLRGLDCSLLQRNDHITPELLLIMTPDGEKEITEAMHQGAYWAAIAVATDSSIPGEELQNHLAAQ